LSTEALDPSCHGPDGKGCAGAKHRDDVGKAVYGDRSGGWRDIAAADRWGAKPYTEYKSNEAAKWRDLEWNEHHRKAETKECDRDAKHKER
jgi:hypothetical protein